MSHSKKVVLLLAACSLPLTLPAQTISSFSPEFGQVGQQVSIRGERFFYPTPVVSVKFNGTPATDGAITQDNLIIAKVPVGATTGLISVQKAGGQPVYSPGIFTVIGPGPYIESFSPTSGSEATSVTIEGAHFDGASRVEFNGVPAWFFVQTDNRIDTLAPPEVTTGPISVTSSRGTSTSKALFYVPPFIESFDPPTGRPGTNVTINGRNFTDTTTLLFGGISASFSVQSATQMVASVPAAAPSGPLTILAPGGAYLTTSNFIVEPTIADFTPGSGPAGTTVTITGLNLTNNNATPPSVTFNGVAAGVSESAFGQIVATAPSSTTGPITVTTTDGTNTSAMDYFYPATITSFSPDRDPPGSKVTILGDNLTGATAVRFNGTLSFFEVIDSTSIDATVPPGVTTGPISVETPAGISMSTDPYYGLPSITSFTPTNGLPGTEVTISGESFLGAIEVAFSGVVAPINSVTSTQIVAVVPGNAATGPVSVTAPAGTAYSATPFVLDHQSDLSLTLTAEPDPATVGSNVVYSIEVENTGPSTASGVTITNWLPPAVVLESAGVSQGTIDTNQNPIVASLGELIFGADATISLSVRTLESVTLTNVATVAADQPDPDLSNNTATNVVEVLPSPTLSIAPQGTNAIRISWPAALMDFVLQSSGALTPEASWSNVTTAPVVEGSESVVTETNDSVTKYYRLKQ